LDDSSLTKPRNRARRSGRPTSSPSKGQHRRPDVPYPREPSKAGDPDERRRHRTGLRADRGIRRADRARAQAGGSEAGPVRARLFRARTGAQFALGPGGQQTRLHPRMAGVWDAADIDIVSIASNHAMDWARGQCSTPSISFVGGATS
jgi:hypothetical protein